MNSTCELKGSVYISGTCGNDGVCACRVRVRSDFGGCVVFGPAETTVCACHETIHCSDTHTSGNDGVSEQPTSGNTGV